MPSISTSYIRAKNNTLKKKHIDIRRQMKVRETHFVLVTLGAHTQRGYSSWVSVCLLLYISPLGCLFVSQTMRRIQRAMKVRKYERQNVPLQSYSASSIVRSRAFFLSLRKMRMRLYAN